MTLLFDCWAECGPSKAVEGPDLEPLLALNGILSAIVTLTTALLLPPSTTTTSTSAAASISSSPAMDLAAATSAASLPTLAWLAEHTVKRVAPFFPAAAPSVKQSSTLSDALMQFNLQASQLLAMLLPVAHSHGGPWVQVRVGEKGSVVVGRGFTAQLLAMLLPVAPSHGGPWIQVCMFVWGAAGGRAGLLVAAVGKHVRSELSVASCRRCCCLWRPATEAVGAGA